MSCFHKNWFKLANFGHWRYECKDCGYWGWSWWDLRRDALKQKKKLGIRNRVI